MRSQIKSAQLILESFLAEKGRSGSAPIDREQIVAHATLSGWADHWPEEVFAEIRTLLADTHEIKRNERSRWIVQRRIAIAKLAKKLV